MKLIQATNVGPTTRDLKISTTSSWNSAENSPYFRWIMSNVDHHIVHFNLHEIIFKGEHFWCRRFITPLFQGWIEVWPLWCNPHHTAQVIDHSTCFDQIDGKVCFDLIWREVYFVPQFELSFQLPQNKLWRGDLAAVVTKRWFKKIYQSLVLFLDLDWWQNVHHNYFIKL